MRNILFWFMLSAPFMRGSSSHEVSPSLLSSRDFCAQAGYGATAPRVRGCPEDSLQIPMVVQETKTGWFRKRDLETYEQDIQIATLAGVGLGPLGGFIFYSLIPQTWPAIGVGVASTAVLTGIFHGCARCVRYCEEQQE